MRWSRVLRRRVCGGLVLLLLFMQLATAAYACPAERRTPQDEAAMAAMPGCAGDMSRSMDADLPQLCKAHCQQGEQVVGGTLVGDWAPLPLLLAVIDWRQAALADVPRPGPWLGPPPGAVPPGAPPLYLSLLVLRN
jgi:hypothetical protein